MKYILLYLSDIIACYEIYIIIFIGYILLYLSDIIACHEIYLLSRLRKSMNFISIHKSGYIFIV